MGMTDNNCVIVDKNTKTYRNIHCFVLFFKRQVFTMKTADCICRSAVNSFFWKQKITDPTTTSVPAFIGNNSSYNKQRSLRAICVNREIKYIT